MTKKKVKPRVYYAHSMRIYNTPREKKELMYLRKQFSVICPNKDIGRLSSMAKYLNIVGWAEKVVVSELDGFVSRGVYDEVKHALKLNIPVLCIRSTRGVESFSLVEVKDVEIHNSGDWKRKYGRIILK